MRRVVPTAALVVLALAFGATAAVAKPVPTGPGLTGLGPLESGDFIVYGQLTSPKPKCLSNRRIEIVVTDAGADSIWDIARSSNHGAWVGRGSLGKLDGDKITIRLEAKRVKLGGKTLRCGGAEVLVT